jgi:hypothetical protein
MFIYISKYYNIGNIKDLTNITILRDQQVSRNITILRKKGGERRETVIF